MALKFLLSSFCSTSTQSFIPILGSFMPSSPLLPFVPSLWAFNFGVVVYLQVVETFGLEYINTGDLLRKERLRITIGDGINHETWKHQFLWESMKPNGGGELSGKLLELINIDFGSYDTFVNEFKAVAAIQFGSCWAWLICENFFAFYLHKIMCLLNPFVVI